MNTNKGFAPLVAIIIVAVIVGGIGGYMVFRQEAAVPADTLLVEDLEPTATTTQTAQDVVPTPAPTPKPTPTPTPKPIISNKASAEVVAAINKDGSARVIVGLKGNEFTVPEYNSNDNKKKEEVRKLQDAVLNTLTPADWSNTVLFSYIPAFAGTLTISGLNKLNLNPGVLNITLDSPVPAV